MRHTPALDVAICPLRPAVVAPHGKTCDMSWVDACVLRSAGVMPATRSIFGPQTVGTTDLREALDAAITIVELLHPKPVHRRAA